MKVNLIKLSLAAVILVALSVNLGCKYDVAEPSYYNTTPTVNSSSITSIEPLEATAGTNIITIHGTNFGSAIDTTVIILDSVVTKDTTFINDTTYVIKDTVLYNTNSISYHGVYFDNLRAEIVEFSSTAIKVRRPNLVSDTCTIKVVPSKLFLQGKFKPYRISSVSAKYGGFNDNVALHAAGVDNANNIYVIDQVNQNRIYKIGANGISSYDTTTSALPRFPRSIVVGPDGRLYLIGNGATQGHANINVVDVNVTPYQWSVWRTITGKSVRFGDFDANGYFYAGGGRTDLMIVSPDTTVANRASGMYATGTSGDSIYAIRVFSGYLYVAARLGSDGTKGVWRHSIGAGGVIGSRELYVDFNGDTTFSRLTIRSIGMSSNGTLYIGTDYTHPLLIVDPTSRTVDYFYKNIVPPYAKWFQWGNANSIYLMSGNASPSQEWTFYKVDMGISSAGK